MASTLRCLCEVEVSSFHFQPVTKPFSIRQASFSELRNEKVTKLPQTKIPYSLRRNKLLNFHSIPDTSLLIK